MSSSWKGRHELPVIRRLDYRFDINRLRSELNQFAKEKVWDGLGSDYAHMCETHTKLPKINQVVEHYAGQIMNGKIVDINEYRKAMSLE